MSGARILYPQFRDEQADSRYPFTDRATLVSTEERLDLGRDTFIDATLYTIGGAARAYISAIIVTPELITIQIGDSGAINRARASYNPLSPPASGLLEVLDIFDRPAGMLLTASFALARFSGWPIGTHTFSMAAAEFVSTVVIPAQEPGVRALKVEDSALLTGDVWIVGDRGVVVRQDGETTIRVDIIGSPLFRRYLCEPYNRFEPQTFVQTITVNGVTCGPDTYGNFEITATDHDAADTVLRVYPSDGAIKIEAIGRKVV